MIKMKVKGNWRRTDTLFQRIAEVFKMGILDKYGRAGVQALSSATPVNTGRCASSWYYVIKRKKNGFSLVFCNSDVENDALVAVLIQYGHATKNGGWVEGIDYINPTIRPLFDQMAQDLWKEVSK